MKIVLIKHNPQGHHLISHLVPVPYVRPIFVFQTLSVWRSPVLHFISFAQHEFARWDNVHDFTSVFYPSETFGHTRVLLAFYTPSVTSKSLLISLLFLERPIFVFQTLSVWRSPVLALHLFRPACSWWRWGIFTV